MKISTGLRGWGLVGLLGCVLGVACRYPAPRRAPDMGVGREGAGRGQAVEVRRAIRSDVAELKARAARYGLVDLADVDPTILVDLRYATSDNPVGRPLYPPNMPCFVHRETAGRLKRAQESLRSMGFSLRVWDAWRPPEVHRQLWEASRKDGSFTNPADGWSDHCSGSAVDVTLVDSAGYEMRLPTGHDDVGASSGWVYWGEDPQVRENLGRLQLAMSRGGFHALDTEWWHFVDPHRQSRPPVFAHQIDLELPGR